MPPVVESDLRMHSQALIEPCGLLDALAESSYGVLHAGDEQHRQIPRDAVRIGHRDVLVDQREQVPVCGDGEIEGCHWVGVVPLHIGPIGAEPSVRQIGIVEASVVRLEHGPVEERTDVAGASDPRQQACDGPGEEHGCLRLVSGAHHYGPVDQPSVSGEVSPQYERSHAVPEDEDGKADAPLRHRHRDAAEIVNQVLVSVVLREVAPVVRRCHPVSEVVVAVHGDAVVVEEQRERLVALNMLDHSVRYLEDGPLVLRLPFDASKLRIPSGGGYPELASVHDGESRYCFITRAQVNCYHLFCDVLS